MVTFWFYERPAHGGESSVIHASWCRTCNEERGYKQRIRNRRPPEQLPFGRWHGPYLDSLEATAAAHRILSGSTRRIRPCGLCIDRNSSAPLRHRVAPNRSHDVAFWVHKTREGSLTAHASTCPSVTRKQTTTSRDEEAHRFRMASEGDWYGPYDRLTSALSKVEALIKRNLRSRIRHCMTCGRNSRLHRLDDLLAKPFTCDAPTDTATYVASASNSAKHIVCLECGKARKILQRHLRQVHQVTPEQYRRKWNLPADYPMIPQGHLKQMLRKAREAGLNGQGGRLDHIFMWSPESD
jgi:hypothetical protein